jgi:hypothetical protein
VGFSLALVLVSCSREEPIVIRFEARDLAGPAAARGDSAADAAAPRDASSHDAAAARPLDAGLARAGRPECAAAADCVVVPLDCCDCANGGKQTALPKARRAAYEAARAKRCKGTMCTQMLSTDSSCGKRAACESGHCVLRSK